MDFLDAIIEDLTGGSIVVAGLPDGMSLGIALEVSEAVKHKGLGQWSIVRSVEAGQQIPAQSVREHSTKGLVLWVDATCENKVARAWGEYALRIAGSPKLSRICIAMNTACAKACREDRGLRRRFWKDFVTSTDSRVLAERHVRRLEHSEEHTALKCTLVAKLAGPDLAFATKLANTPLKRILDPENYPLESIWAAQISVLFPLIERERRCLLETYRGFWNLPHLRELEIGDMAAQAQQSGALSNELERLNWLRRVRNDLAHLKIVSWATLNSRIARQIVDFT